MLLVPKPINELDIKFSYQEGLNVVLPDKSEQEKFFKVCSYVIQTGKTEIYLEQSRAYEQKTQSANSEHSFQAFLNILETCLNAQKQNLARDFSNYAEILTSEHLQDFYTVIRETEALDFLLTVFTFELNTDAVFLFLLLNHWRKLTDETVYSAFLDVLDQHPLPSDFEFGIKYLDLPVSDQWLVVDTRILLIFTLKYLAERPNMYETLKERFAPWYEYIVQQQLT